MIRKRFVANRRCEKCGPNGVMHPKYRRITEMQYRHELRRNESAEFFFGLKPNALGEPERPQEWLEWTCERCGWKCETEVEHPDTDNADPDDPEERAC